jgi:hypothetical protein
MSRIRLAVAIPVLGVLLVTALVGCAGSDAPSAFPTPAAVVLHTPPAEQSAVLTLRAWDAQRASAYASGSVADLRSLYVRGSAAGEADQRLLKAYVARGLVVDGMRMQVLALDVVRATPSVLRVRVTDRLVGAEARGPTGVLPLPRDSPSTRVVTLRAVAGRWLVESVRQGGGQP